MTEASFEFGGKPATQQGAPTAEGGTALDRLKTKTVETLRATTEDWPVPARDGFDVRYCTFISKDEWNLYVNAHQGDPEGLVAAVLVEQCRGIVMDGELAAADGGGPLTFKSPDLQASIQAEDPYDAVWKLYLREGDASRVFASLQHAAGWDTRAPLNPTRR